MATHLGPGGLPRGHRARGDRVQPQPLQARHLLGLLQQRRGQKVRRLHRGPPIPAQKLLVSVFFATRH